MSNIENTENFVKYSDFTKFVDVASKKVKYYKNRNKDHIKDKATLKANVTILNEDKQALQDRLNEVELKLKSYQSCDIQDEVNAFGFTNEDFDEMLRQEEEMEKEIYNKIVNEMRNIKNN